MKKNIPLAILGIGLCVPSAFALEGNSVSGGTSTAPKKAIYEDIKQLEKIQSELIQMKGVSVYFKNEVAAEPVQMKGKTKGRGSSVGIGIGLMVGVSSSSGTFEGEISQNRTVDTYPVFQVRPPYRSSDWVDYNYACTGSGVGNESQSAFETLMKIPEGSIGVLKSHLEKSNVYAVVNGGSDQKNEAMHLRSREKIEQDFNQEVQRCVETEECTSLNVYSPVGEKSGLLINTLTSFKTALEALEAKRQAYLESESSNSGVLSDVDSRIQRFRSWVDNGVIVEQGVLKGARASFGYWNNWNIDKDEPIGGKHTCLAVDVTQNTDPVQYKISDLLP